MIIIAARIAQPCLVFPTALPKVQVSPAPSDEDREHLDEVRDTLGFSNGCAALALKKPPPLVPSILIAICDATGPSAIDLLRAFHRRRGYRAGQCLRNAERNQHQRIDDADWHQDVERDLGQIDPEIADRPVSRRAKPRISANAIAMPVAADRKLCTASAAIWVKFDMVASPA